MPPARTIGILLFFRPRDHSYQIFSAYGRDLVWSYRKTGLVVQRISVFSKSKTSNPFARVMFVH